jgi:hypothetical protein
MVAVTRILEQVRADFPHLREPIARMLASE